MTTMNIQNISHKRSVPTKYTPNSYRIFCEDINNNSLPEDAKYSSQAPALYTQPLIVPAQAIEERNRPHAGRMANFIRENAHTLNEPVNRVSAKNVNNDQEKRWWEWQLPKDDIDTKLKKRSQSSYTINTQHEQDLKTTYQKDHGYLNNFVKNGNKPENEYNIGGKRHSYNPNNAQAIGIVPINDLNTFTKPNEAQRVFVDKMSFEHDYDSRKDNNYPMRGKRHGAFVVEQTEPKPVLGTRSRPNSNKGTSVWDVMHPDDNIQGNQAPNTQIYKRQPNLVNDEQRNQRRDPIGYFEDTKFGGSFGANLANLNPAPNFNQNLKANTQEPVNNYHPSWNSNNNEQLNDPPNDLLDAALMYQKPILVGNGYQN